MIKKGDDSNDDLLQNIYEGINKTKCYLKGLILMKIFYKMTFIDRKVKNF